jgi:hypothetical protein
LEQEEVQTLELVDHKLVRVDTFEGVASFLVEFRITAFGDIHHPSSFVVVDWWLL